MGTSVRMPELNHRREAIGNKCRSAFKSRRLRMSGLAVLARCPSLLYSLSQQTLVAPLGLPQGADAARAPAQAPPAPKHRGRHLPRVAQGPPSPWSIAKSPRGGKSLPCYRSRGLPNSNRRAVSIAHTNIFSKRGTSWECVTTSHHPAPFGSC